MGYKIYRFQNTSPWSDEKPTVSICKDDPGWDEALAVWKQGKPPTESPLWRKGVYASTEEIVMDE